MGDRKVYGLFAEFAIPIVKNLDLTLAGRFDDYSDFGNTFNPKVGLRWQPIREVLFRGSYNTGFRAPTLYEIYQPPSLTFTTDNHDDPVLCPGGNPVPGASAGVVCGQQVLQRDKAGPPGSGCRPILWTPKIRRLSPSASSSSRRPTGRSVSTTGTSRSSSRSALCRSRRSLEIRPSTRSRFVRCSQLPAGPGPGQDRSDIDVCLNFPTFDPIAFIDTPNENLGELKTDGFDVSIGWRVGRNGLR